MKRLVGLVAAGVTIATMAAPAAAQQRGRDGRQPQNTELQQAREQMQRDVAEVKRLQEQVKRDRQMKDRDLLILAAAAMGQRAAAPACGPAPGRKAERLHGAARRGDRVTETTASGWILRLAPDDHGWFLQVTMKGREAEDLSRLTPPWHFVPNPREIEGWHFRNAGNTGPNDGSVNAPGELRDFIFSPAVGREIEYNGSATTAEEVEKVRAFGRGWFHLESYRLTPPRPGERAAFETITFSACLTWPAG